MFLKWNACDVYARLEYLLVVQWCLCHWCIYLLSKQWASPFSEHQRWKPRSYFSFTCVCNRSLTISVGWCCVLMRKSFAVAFDVSTDTEMAYLTLPSVTYLSTLPTLPTSPSIQYLSYILALSSLHDGPCLSAQLLSEYKYWSCSASLPTNYDISSSE